MEEGNGRLRAYDGRVTLLRYIVKGFGWQVGSELAQEAIDDLRQGGAGGARVSRTSTR